MATLRPLSVRTTAIGDDGGSAPPGYVWKLRGADEYLAQYRDLHGRWGFSTLVIEAADAIAAGGFSFAHADPFDRMIIAQSRRLDAAVVTSNTVIRQPVDRSVW